MSRKWFLFVLLCGALVASRSLSEENGPAPQEIRDLTRVFEERMMIVKGQGVAPADRPLSAGQKEVMALRVGFPALPRS